MKRKEDISKIFFLLVVGSGPAHFQCESKNTQVCPWYKIHKCILCCHTSVTHTSGSLKHTLYIYLYKTVHIVSYLEQLL